MTTPPAAPTPPTPLTTGPIIQLAWVSADLERTERDLGAQFGIGQWIRMRDIRFTPADCTYRGQPAQFSADISLAYCGDLQLEIIRPVDGESIYTEFIAQHGGGQHHICFEVADMATAVQQATELGHPVIQQGVMADGAMEFAYLQVGETVVELAVLQPAMREIFASIKAASQA